MKNFQILGKSGVALFVLLTSLAAAQQDNGYVLGPGDQLAISVFGEPDLSVEFMLSDNGALNYPFLGEIRVAGLTMPELEKALALAGRLSPRAARNKILVKRGSEMSAR